ncbi:MAG TPA: tetraacyldisaccharide 4'-kinase [Candidatus Aminicenantes bacterium]|nr:tetraacyldisaccharide 4'-kinase [Candidatus Aminicenantes bacterium]
MKLLSIFLSLLYQSGMILRNYLYDHKLRPIYQPPLPVISVGNITFGGSEKTPLARFLLHFFYDLGFKPALISRGYKGRWEKKGGIVSDGQQIFSTWEEAGDEPFMIAREFPQAGVFVGRHRLISCQRAHQLGFNLAILDDGFQHRQLARNLDLVLHHLEPFSLQREPLSSLQRADIILMKQAFSPVSSLEKKRQEIITRLRLPKQQKIFFYQLQPEGFFTLKDKISLPLESLRSKKIIAFCGLARPQRFFNLLHQLGIQPLTTLIYPDHYPYPRRALHRIGQLWKESQADFLCVTEKDAIKLEGREETVNWPLLYLKISLQVEEAFLEELKKIAQNWPK